VQKAIACGADAIVLDLEDAVPIAEKATTSGAITAALLRYPTPRPCQT
jgi:citrate lyase beta subunit